VTNDVSEALIARYIALESIQAMEELATISDLAIDTRALPFLKRRLVEEEERQALLAARGYMRMSEKSAQLMNALRPLIVALEEEYHGTAG